MPVLLTGRDEHECVLFMAGTVLVQGSAIVRSVQHVRAEPQSIALLLSCVSVVELWPGANVTHGGSVLWVSGLDGFGADEIALRASPPRRLRTSYETAARWSAHTEDPGRAVLQVSPHGWRGASLRLDISCGNGLRHPRLEAAADAFLAALARAAEARAQAS